MNKINPDMISILALKIFKSGVSTTGEYIDNPVQPDGVGIKVGQITAFGGVFLPIIDPNHLIEKSE